MIFESPVIFYALRDPRDGRARWVGQTQSAEARLRSHMSPGRADASARAQWIRSLKADGLTPLLELLEQGVFKSRAAGERERHWMSVMLAKGEPLLNIKRPGYRPSNATCLKISKAHNKRAAAKRAERGACCLCGASINAVEPALADTLPPGAA